MVYLEKLENEELIRLLESYNQYVQRCNRRMIEALSVYEFYEHIFDIDHY